MCSISPHVAKQKLEDRLAAAAREKLAQASKESKEKQLQAERKRKAALFLQRLRPLGEAEARRAELDTHTELEVSGGGGRRAVNSTPSSKVKGRCVCAAVRVIDDEAKVGTVMTLNFADGSLASHFHHHHRRFPVFSCSCGISHVLADGLRTELGRPLATVSITISISARRHCVNHV